jgi:hypothetical protein
VPPTDAVIIDQAPVGCAARRDADRLLVAVDDLPRTVGWTLEPRGLCRGDVCIQIKDRDRLVDDGHVDIALLAEVLGRVVAVDAGEAIAVFGSAIGEQREATGSLHAPDVALSDLDGREVTLGEVAADKRLLLAWASW